MEVSQLDLAADRYQRALAYYRAGNFARCRDLSEELLADRPDDDACLTLKGMALLELGESSDAIETLWQATQCRADNDEAWLQLGAALLTEGRLREAAEALRTALRLSPDNVRAMIDLANVLFALGDSRDALEQLEAARQARPGDLAILRNLAEMYVSARQPEVGLATVLQILDLQPRDVLARCDAAWLLLQLGRPDEAFEMFRALRSDESEQDHELYAIHGMVMAQLARRDWRRALNLAIEATRLDRFDFTTALLSYISSQVFDQPTDVTEEEVRQRFESEHREHRRLHGEGSRS